MNPKITIVVTVYNIAPYLPRFFESMAKQTFSDYRILIVDDGSEDDSLAICRAHAAKDDRIVIHERPHEGISPARNYSMEQLDTEYTVHADGDDYVEPEYLEHLLSAIEKYHADWAISRVAYQSEGSDHVDAVFPAYGETLVKKEDFPDWLPTLLTDRRLNYLYGKIYKTEFFKTLRVEPDVKQGSDTMINCQYIAKINSLVLIDDPDYHYIKYRARSVTSYAGPEGMARLDRINRFVHDSMEKQGLLNDKMQYAIDRRVLQSGVWTIERILSAVPDKKEQEKQIDAILSDDLYVKTYNRTNAAGTAFEFAPIPPQSGKAYLAGVRKGMRSNRVKAVILKLCPNFIKEWRAKRRAGGNETN